MSDAPDLSWDAQVAAVWASAGERSEEEVVAAIEALAAQRSPGDPDALPERASACDYAGREAAAEPLYRQALRAGLAGDRRSSALVQLASTLRNLGRAGEAVDLLQGEIAAAPADGLDDARAAFLALALFDAGDHHGALRTAVNALAAHLPRYQRAVRHYADALTADASSAVSPDVVLRAYQPTDAGATHEVFHAAVRGTAASHRTPAQVRAWAPEEVDLQRWAQRRAQAWTVVALDGARVVGFADLTDAGEMDMLFVHPDAARRGVASALVAAVSAEATGRGMRRLDVRASRILQPLLERLGFVVDADRPDNRVGSEVLANAAMHLDLAAPATGTATGAASGGAGEVVWNPMVPELVVADLARSRSFYVEVIGFDVAFERADPAFAYLDLAGAQLMLAADHDQAWRTGELTAPRGRGVNLQVEVADLTALEGAIAAAGAPLFRAPSVSTYDVGAGKTESQRELLVQDPDGYLLRFVEVLEPSPHR